METVVCTGFYMKRDDSIDEPEPPAKKVEYLSLFCSELTPYLKEKAKRELNESEEKIRNGLAKLKELIAAEPIPLWTDDDFLMLFLRAKKYDIDRSFQQLKDYSEERSRTKNVFGNEKLLKLATYLPPKLCGILPKRDEEGRAILYFSANELNADEDQEIVIGFIQVLCQYALKFPATQVSGICFIADASVPSLESLQALFQYLRDICPKAHMFPARFKRIDCVNSNMLFQVAFNIIKTILPSKLLQRVTFHGDQKESLLSIYPPEILPEEFGGTMGTLEQIQPIWLDEIKTFLPHLFDSNKHFPECYGS